MKIRMMGTEEECDLAVHILRTGSPGIDILEVSGFVPNRGDSKLGRVYVEARLPEVVR